MSPQWSADGQWIVFGTGWFFVKRATQPAHIMIVKPDGSGARALTTGPGNSGFPSWSRMASRSCIDSGTMRNARLHRTARRLAAPRACGSSTCPMVWFAP